MGELRKLNLERSPQQFQLPRDLFLKELRFRDLGFRIGHNFQAFLVEDSCDRQIKMAPKKCLHPNFWNQ